MPQRFSLGVIAGDGIGPEVVAEGLKVLRAAGEKFDFEVDLTPYDLGAARWHQTGEVLPEKTLEELKQHDVLLLGAVGDPSVPSGILERGLLLKLRFAFEQYVNLRPARLFPGVKSPLGDPKSIDFVVVREGTEGLYLGVGHTSDKGTQRELAVEESINTRVAVERVIRHAFGRAMHRRKHLTLVHKNNVLAFAGDLWTRTFNEVAAEFPEVTIEYLHVDAAAMFFVTQPERFDVIVTDNLFGDILTDVAAAVCGGIGLAASGNINPERNFPSMFEPVHGSAPDIAGKQLADPTATVLSVALLLDHMRQSDAARAVEAAVAADLASRGSQTRPTSAVGDALVLALQK